MANCMTQWFKVTHKQVIQGWTQTALLRHALLFHAAPDRAYGIRIPC